MNVYLKIANKNYRLSHRLKMYQEYNKIL